MQQESTDVAASDNALAAGTIQPVDTIGKRIEAVMARTGMSASAISRKAGLARGHVGLLKSGNVKKGMGETLVKIAQATGVSARWLITGEGSPDDVESPPRDDVIDIDGASPEFSHVPNWTQLLRAARQLAPEVEEWAWKQAEHSNPLATAPLTPRALAELGRFLMNYEIPPPPPPKKKRS